MPASYYAYSAAVALILILYLCAIPLLLLLHVNLILLLLLFLHIAQTLLAVDKHLFFPATHMRRAPPSFSTAHMLLTLIAYSSSSNPTTT